MMLMDSILQIPHEELKVLVKHSINDKHKSQRTIINIIFKAILHTKTDLDEHTERVLQMLLKDDRVDVTYDNDYPIKYATYHGNYKVVYYLLNDKRVNGATHNNLPIRIASERGHSNIVKLLLTYREVNPADCDDESIISASKNGYVDIVKLLLNDDRVNPCTNEFEAIKLALKNGHIDVVKLLLSDKRVKQMNHSHILHDFYHLVIEQFDLIDIYVSKRSPKYSEKREEIREIITMMKSKY